MKTFKNKIRHWTSVQMGEVQRCFKIYNTIMTRHRESDQNKQLRALNSSFVWKQIRLYPVSEKTKITKEGVLDQKLYLSSGKTFEYNKYWIWLVCSLKLNLVGQPGPPPLQTGQKPRGSCQQCNQCLAFNRETTISHCNTRPTCMWWASCSSWTRYTPPTWGSLVY